MANIRLTTLSRQSVSDPVVTQFVEEVADLMKVELLQAFSAQRNAAAFPYKLGTIQAGVKKAVTYDSVPKVVVEKWYTKLPAPKQQTVLDAAPRAAQLDTRLVRNIRSSQIDLRSPKPVMTQVNFLRIFAGFNLAPLPNRILERFDDFVLPTLPGAGGGTAILNKGLRFRVNQVRCIDETDPEIFGKDRIAMGGTATDDRERTTVINQFTVGDFDDGDQVSYPPKVLKTFDLSGGNYPKTFFVVLALAEKDAGASATF